MGLNNLHFHYLLGSSELRRNMKVFTGTDKHGGNVRIYKITNEDLFFKLREKLKLISEHPNFEKLLLSDFERTDKGFEGYFVFEKYTGLNFKRALQKIRYPLQLIVVSELANSIKYLHGVGIYHGGIASNCLFSNTLKIPVIAETLGGCLPSPAITRAPEQVRYPEKVFPGTDIWHLGDFLELVENKTKALCGLLKSCRIQNPEKRPEPAVINRQLRELYAFEASRDEGQRLKDWIHSGIKAAGMGLSLYAGYLLLDYRYENRIEAELSARTMQIEQVIQDERRALFLQWNPPMFIPNRDPLTLGEIAIKLESYYKKPVIFPKNNKDLPLEVDSAYSNWYEIIEVNGLDWGITKNGEIEIYSAVSSVHNSIHDGG